MRAPIGAFSKVYLVITALSLGDDLMISTAMSVGEDLNLEFGDNSQRTIAGPTAASAATRTGP